MTSPATRADSPFGDIKKFLSDVRYGRHATVPPPETSSGGTTTASTHPQFSNLPAAATTGSGAVPGQFTAQPTRQSALACRLDLADHTRKLSSLLREFLWRSPPDNTGTHWELAGPIERAWNDVRKVIQDSANPARLTDVQRDSLAIPSLARLPAIEAYVMRLDDFASTTRKLNRKPADEPKPFERLSPGWPRAQREIAQADEMRQLVRLVQFTLSEGLQGLMPTVHAIHPLVMRQQAQRGATGEIRSEPELDAHLSDLAKQLNHLVLTMNEYPETMAAIPHATHQRFADGISACRSAKSLTVPLLGELFEGIDAMHLAVDSVLNVPPPKANVPKPKPKQDGWD
jgi:hypothetical protein